MDEGYVELMRRRRGELLDRMDAALASSGRTGADVTLVAVSKTVGVDGVVSAIEAGYRVFGENRPQELARKLEGLSCVEGCPDVRFDMIGNLQTNKVNAVLGRVELVHSVGSLHLANAISTRAARRMDAGEMAGPQPVLLEVNVSGEGTKGGFAPDEVVRSLDGLLDLPGIRIEGLMAMAPRGDRDLARRCFAGLRELRDALSRDSGLPLRELSCGMSEDFEEALEEGSTIVRLGRVVFDPSFAL